MESVERHEDEKCRWKYLVKVERCGGQRKKEGKKYLGAAAAACLIPGLTWGYAAK